MNAVCPQDRSQHEPFTGVLITATMFGRWPLCECRRPDVLALLRAHGLDPDVVESVRLEVVDGPLLRVCEFARAADGAIAYDPYGQTAVRSRRDVALHGALPAWWTPRELAGVPR